LYEPLFFSDHGLCEQLSKTPASLMRTEERHDNMPRSAPPTAQSRSHVLKREIIAEPLPQLNQRQPCAVPTLAAERAVVVTIINVRERGGLEFGIFHAPNCRSAALISSIQYQRPVNTVSRRG
jgi:hypothetical protein